MEDLLEFLYLMPIGVVKFRAGGKVEMMNAVASALLLSIAAPDTLQNLYAALAPLAPDLRLRVERFAGPGLTIVNQEWLRSRAGGGALTLSLSIDRIRDDVYMAVVVDVTRLAEQERILYADRGKFFAIFDHVRDYAIYTISLDGIFDEWNQSLQRYAGWLAADVLGRRMDLFFPSDDPQRPQIGLLLAEARRAGSTEIEGWAVKRDGCRIWESTVITALPDEAGTVRGFVVVSRDLTERKRLEDATLQLASRDPLTGAYNRRQGDALIEAEFGRRARYGRPFALLMIDIDHFKAVNDRFGHGAGDAVLVALVQTCGDSLRPSDVVVRWGGDEFLVLLPETDPTAAASAAERLRAILAQKEHAGPDGTPVSFTVCIGAASPTSDDPRDLLRRVDIALYAAKAAGRNRVMLAT